MSTRRSPALALLLALLVTAALAAPPGASSATRARGATTTIGVPSGDRIVGERVAVTGTVPGSRARPVKVQLRSGTGAWATAAQVVSDGAGTYSASVTMPSAPGRVGLRAVAPRASSGGPALPASTSAAVSRDVVAQTASLTVPGTATEGGTAKLTATFTPARRGRAVTIQERVGGSWTRLAQGSQDSRGRYVLTLDDLTVGARTFRATTAASAGAKAITSAARTLEVAPAGAPVTRISDAPGGARSNEVSYGPSISGDGRVAAFSSRASNLVAGDDNGADDVFLRDLRTGAIELVSVASDGTPGNSFSSEPSVSEDGRYVAFTSSANDLVAGDVGGAKDVFVRDTVDDTTIRVSVSTGGTQGNGNSEQPSISADGGRIAFRSYADSLVTGDTNSRADIFVRDVTASTTTRVSVAADGTEGDGDSTQPVISDDGRWVAFATYATALVPGDRNGTGDVVLASAAGSSTLEAVSVDSAEALGNGESIRPTIDADGSSVAFASSATNLDSTSTESPGISEIFVRDRDTGTTTRVSRALGSDPVDNDSIQPSISATGRYVAFTSRATNLVTGHLGQDNDIFLRDVQAGTTQLLTPAADGGPASSGSSEPSIAGDGDGVAFTSLASNLIDPAGAARSHFDTYVVVPSRLP